MGFRVCEICENVWMQKSYEDICKKCIRRIHRESKREREYKLVVAHCSNCHDLIYMTQKKYDTRPINYNHSFLCSKCEEVIT